MLRVAAAEKVVLITTIFLVSFALSKGAISGGYSFAAPALAQSRNMEKRSVYEVIIKKNLFDHTRSDGSGNPIQPTDLSSRRKGISRLASVGKMVLEGIIIFKDQRIAVIREGGRTRGSVKEVRVGDSLGPYKIISIEDEEILLSSRDGREHLLTLFNMDLPAGEKHIKRAGRGGYIASKP